MCVRRGGASCDKLRGAKWGRWASCNKLHGASCNINKFINFVESVRPKRPYGMDVECYIDVAQVTDTSKRSHANKK